MIAVKSAEPAKKTAVASRSRASSRGPEQQLHMLHRTLGNQAVQRLYEAGLLQAKLSLGRPGDRFEQEADRVADLVMRMPEPVMQLKPG
jgi:hypothetical protein